MKNLMIALAIVVFCGASGCEENAVTTDNNIEINDSKSGLNFSEETTYTLLSECECSETGWCTLKEKNKCSKGGQKVFVATAYKIKRPGGKPTVCDELSSCMPPPDSFLLIIETTNPEVVSAEMLTLEGDVYATSYVVDFDEENGLSYLKFEVKNKKNGSEFLMLKAKTLILNDEGEKVEVNISGELGKLDW